MNRRGVAFLLSIGLVCQIVFPRTAFAQLTTVSLNPNEKHQTITGWEATAQAGQMEFPSLFNVFKNELMDESVQNLGINRLRVEIYPGVEQVTDWYAKVISGEISVNDWIHKYGIQIINDNSDPNNLNENGFHFAFVDDQMDTLVLPMKNRLEARGESLFLNINYVDFQDPQNCSPNTCIEHYNYPEEYAEFVLATYKHIKTKYGFYPNAWEMILEPENSAWGYGNGEKIGRAMYRAGSKLKANNIKPQFIAPSVTNMSNLMPYIGGIKAGIKSEGGMNDSEVDRFISENMIEFSYHRYGQNDSVLQPLVAEARARGIQTSQLEHIDADHNELHRDLTVGNVSAWQQYTLAYPEYPGMNGDGGMYYVIKYPDVQNPNPNQYHITMGSRAKFLQQYFKYIRAGAQRIGASSTDQNIDPAAFINSDGSYTVVLKMERGGSIAVNNLPSGIYNVSYTTESEYAKELPEINVSASSSLTATMPNKGVMTIYHKRTPSNNQPTPTVPFTATPTTNPSCICDQNDTCASSCIFNQNNGKTASQIKCARDEALGQPPTSAEKESYCRRVNRTIGDADGDTQIGLIDYLYYVRAVNGGAIPPAINPDFNGDGLISASDREIVISTLATQTY